MAYDEALAERIREIAGQTEGLTERRMFGGLAFMLHGNMALGVVGDELMVRLGADAETALREPHTRPMDFTGRPMKGMLFVDQAGLQEDADLAGWIARGLAFAGSLPAK